MRYCPKCDAEYRDDRPTCAEDGTTLLDRAGYDAELARQGRQPLDARRLVAIALFNDQFEADELAAELSEEGFHTAVVANKASVVGPLTQPGPTTWSLVVPELEADKAAALVVEWRRDLAASSDDAERAAVAEEAATEVKAP